MIKIEDLPEVRGTYRQNALLGPTTWFNVGGPADILFRPKDPEDLSYFLKNKPINLPIIILGVGSNLLIRDKGFRGVVIKLGRGFTDIKINNAQKDNVILEVGAACLSFNASIYAAEHGYKNIEFLSGIPGTIGGALAMNAGAYNSDTSAVLEYAELLDDKGDFHKLSIEDIGYIYRGHTLPEGMIFTKAFFKVTKDKPEDILKRIEDIRIKRSQSQPIKDKTSGSTFKNPTNEKGLKAWQLIDQAGCRGLKIGGAQISEKHCNFMINNGQATAKDLEDLGNEVIKRVEKTHGIKLEWEVQIIGE